MSKFTFTILLVCLFIIFAPVFLQYRDALIKQGTSIDHTIACEAEGSACSSEISHEE